MELTDITNDHINKHISLYGRISNVRTSGAKLCFIILRKNMITLQCVCMKKNINEFDELLKLPNETLIVMTGTLNKLPEKTPLIKSCYYQHFELMVDNYDVVNKPVVGSNFPFSLDDANNILSNTDEVGSEDADDGVNKSNVLLPTRLNNRYFDIKTTINNSIFKIQSGLCNAFREYLIKSGFMEIHSPKILGTSSESGASVFELKYFDKVGYLAQSPQLYKQMAICGDFNKVFEIGPVFRAEKSFSNRHLCEFTGMDIEMALSYPFDYLEVVHQLWKTLTYMFNYIKLHHKIELDHIMNKHKFDELEYPVEPIILTFSEGVILLKEYGFDQSIADDLTTENEKQLGKIVKEKYKSDLFVLTEYPANARPFYTKKISESSNFTKSYDIIMRGQEICSGAQREHDYNILVKQMEKLNIKTDAFEDYLNSFKYGAPPHGGGGFGLERILMLYLNLGNIRYASLFPRDPLRLKP